MQLYLASTSPRRRELLAGLGVGFECLDIGINEDQQPGEPAAAYVERMALEKAAAGFRCLQQGSGALVVAADTVVVLDGQLLGKPATAAEAGAMLQALSGRCHQVMTAFALQTDGGVRVRTVSTRVCFRPVLPAEIDWYWRTGEQGDKAGGYGIQGRGGVFVRSIEGSYSNVVGLPMAELVEALRAEGLDWPVAAG